MTGIFLLVVIALWLFIVIQLVKSISAKLPEKWWRLLVQIFLFIALMPLPLVDEIVGGMQFKKLCEENATIQVDRVKAVGKTVYLLDLPDTQMKGTWVPIRLQPWRYVDATTGEPVVSYNILHATGGLLIRMMSISEGNVPLTFENSCEPGGLVDPLKLFKEFGITQIQRTEKNT